MCPHHGRMRRSHSRSAPASRHRARLIAGLTKMRATPGLRAAVSSSLRCSGRQASGVDVVAVLRRPCRSPTSRRARRRSAAGPASGSATDRPRSRAGARRGRSASVRRAAAPYRRPGGPAIRQPWPSRRGARRKAIRRGWPQARLRDGRMTCQFGPSAGNSTAPREAALGIAADRPCRGRRRPRCQSEQPLSGIRRQAGQHRFPPRRQLLRGILGARRTRARTAGTRPRPR